MQPYIVDLGFDKVSLGQGFESSGIPDGIPSQEKFLAEYCLASVSNFFVTRLFFFFSTSSSSRVLLTSPLCRLPLKVAHLMA